MYIIAPLSNCASPDKRDQFLEYISKIAPVTHAHEPKCRAYAWFRSAGDNDTVPHHWVRGLEVYDDVEANTITHRASTEYKAFRTAVSEKALLARPSDLRYWRPSPVGFLTRGGGGPDTANFMVRGSRATLGGARQYIVVDELTPQAGQRESVLQQLEELAREAQREARVLSFWALHRGDGEADEGLLVFARYKDKDAWAAFMGRSTVTGVWKATAGLLEGQVRTTWVECGLGFLSR
ncbi:hypothetical protein BDV12DRAFT_210756 [Aspergillus spectabilis]